MSKFKIVYDRNSCIGANACVALSPDIFEMGDDGKANLKGGKDIGDGKFELVTESDESILEAAQGCPVDVIKVIDMDTGEEID